MRSVRGWGPMSLAAPPALSLSLGGHIRCWGDPEGLWGRFLGCPRARSPSMPCLVCPSPSPPPCRGGQKTPEPRGESSGAPERHPRNLHPDLLVLEPPSSRPGTPGISGSAPAARRGDKGPARAGTGDFVPRQIPGRTFPEGRFASIGSG